MSSSTNVGWVSDPNGRGTAGLVTSCVLTLGLCAWSALHLNIPPKGETQRQYWSRNVRWVLLGVFIPELVILAAWRQWASCRELSAELYHILKAEEALGNEKRSDLNSSESTSESSWRANVCKREKPTCSFARCQSNIRMSQIPTQAALLDTCANRQHDWTSLHSFYASMGGFVFDFHHDGGDFGPSFVPTKYNRLALTPQGVILLARCGYLPDINPDDIKDKSKSDGLAKALVILQASWMLIQTISRKIVHLPVSLLEVNTVAHVFCAFVIYVLWWKKPREVREPTVLQGEWADQLAAFMYMSSRTSGQAGDSILPASTLNAPELARFDYAEPVVADIWREKTRTSCGIIRQLDPLDGENSESGTTLEPGSSLGQCSETSAGHITPGTFSIRPDYLPALGADIEASSDESTQQARFRLAAQAITNFPAVRARFTRHLAMDESQPGRLSASATQLVVTYAPNWPSDYLLPGLQGEVMGMVLWFASMAYGGIHLAAWHDDFPSEVETIVWRFSAIFIGSSGMFWFVLNVLAHYSMWASSWWDRFYGRKAHWVQYMLLGAGAVVCGVTYIVSRIFLVVDGIVSLRSAPSATYESTDWTIFVPHL